MGLILLACMAFVKKSSVVENEPIQDSLEYQPSKGERIIAQAIKAHGGALYDTADYTFMFRGNQYRFTNNGNEFRYEVKRKASQRQIKDVIINGLHEHYVENERIVLDEKLSKRYYGALNSVIYFATLPSKLKDEAVNKKYIETITLKGEQYDVVEVTFNEEGGGDDHEDEFYYWVNQQTSKIDYLAYNYKVNGGGIRFRSAFNRRVVDGITFQDYINWKAAIGTPLKELARLYENNELKEVSKILTENVKSVHE